MDGCLYCTLKPGEKEGRACGDLWLEKRAFGWKLGGTLGESEVFYCPWCGRDLTEEEE
jgi:hypothetical protein